ncbi:MFS transporter [Methanoplanus limicola]|uniref:Major facilitator superfamily MFS_1 n=1 Tax=Methanoplanus limicola DSM 2279 TaxID=937775 RepID=H1Z0P1_9EURY|nr:MFS transporter [Methanoplanus limicola]EHQ35298.1 major facilitator superfamily MFS_1 [Methanoplanus limicola DSM 2279]
MKEREQGSWENGRYYTVALALFSLCILIPMMSETMLIAALPVIEHEFSVSGILGAWILPVVLLVGAAFAPFAGTLGDCFGRKKVLCIFLSFYVAGTFMGGFAWDIWSLLFFRFLQGIGIAASPIAYALVSEQFPLHKIPMGIGFLAASYGAGSLTGVLFGAYIIDFFGWRATYYILSPVVAVHLIAVLWLIRPSYETNASGIDWKGTLCLFVSLLSLMISITLLYDSSGAFLWALPAMAICIISGLLFFYIERRADFPAIDLSMLKKPVVIVISATAILVSLITYLLIQTMPFIIQSPTGLMLDARFVGLVMMPGAVADMTASPLAGRWMRRRSAKVPVYLGAFMMLAGCMLYFVLPQSVISLAIIWVLFSGGMGIVATCYMIIMINSVPKERTAGATGLLHSSINIGGMAGPMVAGVFLAAYNASFTIGGEKWVLPTEEAFDLSFGFGIFLTLLILLLVYLICRYSEGKPT